MRQLALTLIFLAGVPTGALADRMDDFKARQQATAILAGEKPCNYTVNEARRKQLYATLFAQYGNAAAIQLVIDNERKTISAMPGPDRAGMCAAISSQI